MKKEVRLLPHNEEAYDKLTDCLKSNQMVAINHATGTGKSFILLKYLANNMDKRILYLAPSYPIIDQLVEEHMSELNLKKGDFKKLDTEIYSNLLAKDMKKYSNSYDIIILDEYHRCGAKKWGKQVNKLLSYIKENHKEVKVIGTTATETRYLDNNKNMNNILFDGVCASNLSLADAIIKGILPAPVYICATYDLIERVKKIKTRVNSKIFFQREQLYYEKLLRDLDENISQVLNDNKNLNSYLKKENAKCLAFSSTISDIEASKQIISDIFINKNIVNYVVNSHQSKEKNKEVIKEFRNAKDDFSVLHSVNILNEGVHIKNIDAIVMLRPTTSPIIYFQQLGRLLSYSGRKDELVVFDLVNNLKKHNVIYMLYQEIVFKAKELIKKDPVNKERYEQILQKFQILDYASKAYEIIDKIEKDTSIKEMISRRLKIAIDILSDDNYSNFIEKQQAIIDIFKYEDYITVEIFEQIKKLDIIKPSLLNMEIEEFKKLLGENHNIYEKKQNKIKILEKNIISFFNKNKKMPSLLSLDPLELSLSELMQKEFEMFNKDFKDYIIENIRENNYSSLYDKLVYEIAEEYDSSELLESINIALNKKIYINDNIIDIVRKLPSNIRDEYLNKIKKHNTNYFIVEIKSPVKNEEKNSQIYENIGNEILFKTELEKIEKKCMLELSQTQNEKVVIDNFYKEILQFIKENNKFPTIETNSEQFEKELFYKNIIYDFLLKKYGYSDNLQNLRQKLNADKFYCLKKEIINEVIDFVKKHNGNYPSSKIDNSQEKTLAKNYLKIKKYLTNDDLVYMKKHLSEFDSSHSELIQRYIIFIEHNKRYPLLSSNDQYELDLLFDYQRNEKLLTKDEKLKIDGIIKSIGRSKITRNTYREMIKLENEKEQNTKGKKL